LAHRAGFEPTTPRFVVWCSIQLSYRCLQTRRATSRRSGGHSDPANAAHTPTGWSARNQEHTRARFPARRHKHLASAQMRSLESLRPVNHPPKRPAMVTPSPLGPILQRGFGFSAPQPPEVLTGGSGQLLERRGISTIARRPAWPAFAPAVVSWTPRSDPRDDYCKSFSIAAPSMGPALPCCSSTAHLSAPGRTMAWRSSCTTMGRPLQAPTGMSS
jgi:hypothetical protein